MEIVHDIVQKIVFACFIINSENKYTYPWSIWLIFKYNINHHELILETLCRDYIFNIGSVYTFKSYKYLNSFNDSNFSSSKPVKMAFILSYTNTTTFSIIVFRYFLLLVQMIVVTVPAFKGWRRCHSDNLTLRYRIRLNGRAMSFTHLLVTFQSIFNICRKDPHPFLSFASLSQCSKHSGVYKKSLKVWSLNPSFVGVRID